MLLDSMRHPLYLHIGHGKVGSSSIQQALARDLDALRSADFLVADRKLEFCEAGPMDGSANRYFRDLNALGDDAPADVLAPELAVANAPAPRGTAFTVPRVLDDEAEG